MDPSQEAAETLAQLRYIHPAQAQDVAGLIALAYARASRTWAPGPRKEVEIDDSPRT